MISVKKFVFNPFQENTYVVWENELKNAIIIDPGCLNQSEENMIVNFISENELQINSIVNTHLHLDHYFGNYFLKNKYNCKIFYSKTDEFLLPIMLKQAENYGVTFNQTPLADEYLENIPFLKIGENIAQLIHTPGHSPGEYSIYFEKEKILFSGDVLFREGIGRTDIWKSNYQDLLISIKHKLFNLPNDVVVFPGHDESTTILHEKENNSFL